MKKTIRYILSLTLLLCLAYFVYQKIEQDKEKKEHQAWVATLEHTASPNVQILIDTIMVDYLQEKRTLAIYLPEDYRKDSIDYPVIYFLDGQSLFDQKIQEGMEWQIDEVLDSIGQLNQQQAIVIGIYNSDRRMKEYKPFPSDRWYSDKVVSGNQHADWIVKKLKPWIDTHYRTKQDAETTIIGGASLGGLMAYYMLMQYPETFGKAIVFSPSFWVNQKVYTLHQNNKYLNHQKIYFNAGQLETPTVESIQKMERILLDHGVPQSNIKLDIEQDEGHWHATWRKGFKKVYPWIVE